MPERYCITRMNLDPRDPTSSLAHIVFKREPGVMIQREVAEGEQLHPVLSLTVDSYNEQHIKNRWDSITVTPEFQYLVRAYQGDTEFFKETSISPTQLILTCTAKGFFRFYNFLRSLAYDRAIEQAEFQEEPYRAKELKLEARGNWTPRFRWYQKLLVPSYIDSILTRIYNLVTTGEEQPTMRDRALDFIMG